MIGEITKQTKRIPKLQLIDIHHDFVTSTRRLPLFCGIDLQINTAQVVAIIGASGVGKTTLFNIAAGILKPKSGQVLIDGVDCTGVAGKVGYMLQKDLLLPFKRVYDNIALPLLLQNMPKADIDAMIMPRLAEFGLQDLIMRYPDELSGGQKQRAALLRTYLSNSELMLLDEPFSALDFVTKAEMYEWFNRFASQKNLTCLIITHDIDEAIFLSDEIYVLKDMPAAFAHHFIVPKQPDFQHSADYLQLKQAILSAIRT